MEDIDIQWNVDWYYVEDLSRVMASQRMIENEKGMSDDCSNVNKKQKEFSVTVWICKVL